jgi:RNA polymerase-binding protein DksA
MPASSAAARAAAKKTAVNTSAAAEKPAKRASSAKVAAKKAPTRKSAATSSGRKAPGTTQPPTSAAPAGKKAATRKSAPTSRTAVSKTPRANGTPAGSGSVTKTAARAGGASKATAKQPASKSASSRKPAAKVTPKGAGSPGTSRSRASRPDVLAVRSGETPWTARQVQEVRDTLAEDARRLTAEIEAAGAEIDQLLREGGEGAGNDQADVGSHTFERDHEMSLQRNALENLRLVEEALVRIDNGTYGLCLSCGRPIGKMRLLAFPRATLCLECKQREERR